MRIPVSDLTNFPELFTCYWGNFDSEKNKHGINKDIIQNRNQFVAEFKLKKTKASIPDIVCKFSNGEVDHKELYYTKDKKYVFICSNYNTSPPPELDMVEYKPLYSASCTTYIKVFNSIKEFNQILKHAYRKERISYYIWVNLN